MTDRYYYVSRRFFAPLLQRATACADVRLGVPRRYRYYAARFNCVIFVVVSFSVWMSNPSERSRTEFTDRMSITAACPALAYILGSSGSKTAVAAAVEEATEAYAFDPHLIYAVMASESNCRETVRSRRGAVGPMQLMPATASWLGVNPYSTRDNIRGGTKYLAILLKQFDGDLRLALAAYNAGPTKVRRYAGIPPYAETRRYVDRVIGYYKALRLITGENTSSLERV